MPRNIVTEIMPMIASVSAAFFALGAAERRHPVGDRLDAGERGGARRERVQDHEEPDRRHGRGQLGRRRDQMP